MHDRPPSYTYTIGTYTLLLIQEKKNQYVCWLDSPTERHVLTYVKGNESELQPQVERALYDHLSRQAVDLRSKLAPIEVVLTAMAKGKLAK